MKNTSTNIEAIEQRLRFKKRLLAYIFDGLLIAVVATVLSISVGIYLAPFGDEIAQFYGVNERIEQSFEESRAGLEGDELEARELGESMLKPTLGTLFGSFWGVYLMCFLSLLGITLPEAFWGVSPAKYLVGIRIRNADNTQANSRALFLRYFIKHLGPLLGLLGVLFLSELLLDGSELVSAIVYLGYLLVLGKGKMTLHDRISGTAVFRSA